MNKYFILIAALAVAAACTAAEKITLVKDGKAMFRIVTGENLKRVSKVGPEDLANFTREATGARVKIVPASKLAEEKEKLINVFIGIRSYGDRYSYDYPKPAGFRIIFPEDGNIVIAGVPTAGEDFNSNDGVFWFLEKYLGVHFLMPGQIGTHVPKFKGDWTIPKKDIQRIPDMFARQFSGVHGQSYTSRERFEQNEAFLFAMRRSMTGSVSLKLNHNVGNLIDPEKYATTNPEFFPLIDGKRHIPPKVDSSHWKLFNWEPCYTAPGIAEAAAESVIKYFEENPDLYSCSLSVNDSGNICQCENCTKINAKLPEGSESQTYYEWVCKVVDIVKQKYPDRNFGILNYWVTKEMPENVKLDKMVVPIVCEDLNFYVVPELHEKLEKRLAEWDKIASNIGWWDYSFEGDYMIPSYNARFMAKYIKNLYKNHNLRVYTDELHPGRHYKNAPETYMITKLLWDVDQDPEKLLDEWFNLAVGPKAAPYLKSYFDIWENVWTHKIPKTNWFINRAAIGAPFLQRRDGDYLDAIEYEDISKAMDLLLKCRDNAPDGKEKMRAQFFLDYFAMAADMYFIPYLNSKKLENAAESIRYSEAKTVCTYDFKDKYAPWVPWQSDKHTAILRHTSSVGHEGAGCLELNMANSLPTGMVFYRRPLDFKLKPGAAYRLSVWCKGENLEGNGGAQMVLFFQHKTKGVLGRGTNAKGALSLKTGLSAKKLQDGKWHKMELYLSVPETAWADIAGVNCQLEAEFNHKNATVYYDDFKVEEIKPVGLSVFPEFGIMQSSSDKVEQVYIDPETGEKLGKELIVDGDMEANGVEAWLNSYTPLKNEKSTAFARSGKQSLHIVSDSSGDGVLQIIKPIVHKELFLIPEKGFKKGATYRVQAWVKNSRTDEYNDFRLAGTALKTPMKTDSSEWQLIRHYVTYDKNVPTDFLTIGYGTSKSDVYVDDVSIRQVLDK